MNALQEVGFKDAFWPMFAMDEAEPNTMTNLALRASFALLAAGVSWVLYFNSPDKGMVHTNTTLCSANFDWSASAHCCRLHSSALPPVINMCTCRTSRGWCKEGKRFYSGHAQLA